MSNVSQALAASSFTAIPSAFVSEAPAAPKLRPASVPAGDGVVHEVIEGLALLTVLAFSTLFVLAAAGLPIGVP